MIKPGDFVTTCSAGYWQLLELKPKLATEDYRGETVRWKKGQQLGQWAIVKKAFTPKMKPKIEFEYVDASWLRPVSGEVLTAIHQYFQENPAWQAKYDGAEVKLRPAITNCWLNLPPEGEAAFRRAMDDLPARYTMDAFWKVCKPFQKYIAAAPGSYLLNFLAYPWDVDKKCNQVYSGCELRKL